MTPALGVALLGAGVGLVYAAVTGQNPVTELRTALTTGRTDGRPTGQPFGAGIIGAALNSVRSQIIDAATGSGSGSTPTGGGSASPQLDAAGDWPNDPRDLVAIGQGSHRLTARAAAGFAAWERNYGRKIPVTDSYRSYAQQDAAHRRDPQRFASPDGSAHVEARAVDVNLPALGIGSTMSDAGYKKLFDAAKAAGWCGYHNGQPGKETWHFSFGVCK